MDGNHSEYFDYFFMGKSKLADRDEGLTAMSGRVLPIHTNKMISMIFSVDLSALKGG